MKKIILFFFLISFSIDVKSQCNNGENYYPNDIFYPPVGIWSSATTQSYAGDVIRIYVSFGDWYNFSTTAFYGGVSASYDTELTLYDENGNLLTYDDGPGQSLLYYQSTYDGIAYLHLNEYPCLINEINTEVRILKTENLEGGTYSCLSDGCVESIDGTGDFSSLDDCLDECYSYECIEGSCYEAVGSSGSFLTLESCESNCESYTSYDCIEGSCYEAIGLSGSFLTLESCESYCEGGDISLFECTQQGCLDTNVSLFEYSKFPEAYEDYYESIDDCLSNCELPMVYYCDEQTGCYEDVIGLSSIYYNSINDCETQCFTIAETYNCIGNACVNPLDGSGTFTSLNDCVTNCDIQQSFNCINGNCIDPLDGTGEFSLFGECYTSCNSTDIEIINENNFNIFPNPANDKFNLSFYLNYNNKVEITIMNTLGQVIYNTEKSYSTGHVNQEITLKNNGIFFILLESNEFIKKTKIIIN